MEKSIPRRVNVGMFSTPRGRPVITVSSMPFGRQVSIAGPVVGRAVRGPENVEFFDTTAAARLAGYRACLRCDPDGEVQTAGERRCDHEKELLERACRIIECAEEMPALGELAAELSITKERLRRVFVERLGLTPKAYADAVRRRRLRTGLASARTVTEAIYDAGYAASSRFYERDARHLGMTPEHARRRGEGERIIFTCCDSCLGRVLVARASSGICAVEIGDRDEALVAALHERFSRAEISPGDEHLIAEARAVLDHIELPEASGMVALDIRGTAFQEQVWRALLEIPRGETRSYSDIARRLGRPSASRAIARACADNPLLVVVPCHRVIAKDGTIGGYRAGLERKRALLENERNSALEKSVSESRFMPSD